MIKYKADLFGLRTLCYWNGSAVFRALIPALASTGILLVYQFTWCQHVAGTDIATNPYVITAFVSFFAYLLVFRLNFSYQRYWEATTQVYQMSSKWLDSAIVLASFHYQCAQYDDARPLTFGANPKVKNETRERERLKRQTLEETEQIIDQVYESKGKGSTILRWMFGKKKPSATTSSDDTTTTTSGAADTTARISQQTRRATSLQPTTKAFKPNRKFENEKGNMFAFQSIGLQHGEKPSHKPTTKNTDNNSNNTSPTKEWRNAFANGRNIKAKRFIALTGLESQVPSLFLQEAAHLYSLLSAVAMSTLRADIEGAQSPLSEYVPGQPFPPVNPDDMKTDYAVTSKVTAFCNFVLGIDRTDRQRTLYNAARPFLVIGGISDEEATMLQDARGPYAQMALCNFWIKEFVSREILNGSTGNVDAPILARVYEFISAGVAAYNQCRKVAFVPFPFPHDQMTTVFVFVALILLFPFLYVSYVKSLPFACIMNFVTVLSFKGMHEVARELSHPYITVPNDLPLNNFHAQFNEALITMYAGFHPDSWRKAEEGEQNSFDDYDDFDDVKLFAEGAVRISSTP